MTTLDTPSFEIPRLISPDDHVVEPRELWTDRLPSTLRERGPRTIRKLCSVTHNAVGEMTIDEDRDAPGARWCDIWIYEDMVTPYIAGYSFIGALRKAHSLMPITYDDMEPGCYQQAERLRDMDDNYTDVSLCF